MRVRSTWVLLAILLALAAYLLLVERRRGMIENEPNGDAATLLPYEKEEVERVALVNPRGERIVIERRGDLGWLITHPIAADAADEMIDVLLVQLVPGIKLEEYRDVRDPGEFGFDDPFATVILSARGRARPDTIIVGDTVPTGSRCYARLGSSTDIVVTRELTHDAVDKNLYSLRDKNLLDIGIDEIDGLTVENGADRIELIREQGEWRFASSGLRADRLLIERLILTLSSAIIRAFVREDLAELAPFGLIDPPRRLILAAGRRRVSLAFGASDERMVYVVRSGIDKVLQVPSDLLRIFLLEPAAFRAKELTLVDPGAVSELRLEWSGGTVLLSKGDTSWRFADRAAAPPSAGAVDALIGAIVSTRFTEVFDPAEAPPELREGSEIAVRLRDRNKRITDEILIAVSTGGFEIGSSTSAGAIGRLREGTAERIARLIARLGE